MNGLVFGGPSKWLDTNLKTGPKIGVRSNIMSGLVFGGKINYRIELEKFYRFLNQNIQKLNKVNISLIRSHIQDIKVKRKLLNTSIYKKIAILKSYFNFLDWDDVNLDSKVLFIRSTKNKSDRIIPIHNKVLELLELYLDQRLPISNRALVVGEKDKRLTVTSFTNLIRMHLMISGLKKKEHTAHSFRHSFAARLTEKNVNILLVQRLLGHLSLDSTKIYAHFENENYRNAIDFI